MRILTGTFRNGLVAVEGEALPEGATVTVGVPEEEATFDLTPEEEAELQARIEEADRGEMVDLAVVLERLRQV